MESGERLKILFFVKFLGKITFLGVCFKIRKDDIRVL